MFSFVRGAATRGALLCTLLALSAPTAHAQASLGADLAGLLAYARQNSPELIARRLEAEAARERVQPAGALADPTLRVELENITRNDTAGPNLLPSRVEATKYTLIQPLTLWGKRELRREAASAEAEASEAMASSGWVELAARIKAGYANYYMLSRQIELTREMADLLARLAEVVQNRYANGLVPQQDAIRVQVERTGLQSELVQMELELHHATTRINGLLARPAHAPLAAPQGFRPLPAAARLDHAALDERLRAKNPQLFGDDARLRASEKGRDAVYRNRYPDLALGIAPVQNNGRVNNWGLMLEMNVPLQQESRRSQEREADKLVEAARARRAATASQLTTELAESLAALESSRRVETLVRGSLLPQAELTFQAALAGYENGKLDFATLLDAQRQIRLAKRDALKSAAEQQVRLADIERLIGEDL